MSSRGEVALPVAWPQARRAVADVLPLVAFRLSRLRRRSRRMMWLGASVAVAITAAAAVLPALSQQAGSSARADELLLLLPSAYLTLLVTSMFAVIAAGGGRELLPRDDGVGFPVSPTTDHLGALLMAPLNIAWAVQAWSLLGLTAFAVGGQRLWAAQLTTVCWLFVATASAQAIGWCVEYVRRRRYGVLVVRMATLVGVLGFSALVAAENVTAVLDRSPTVDAVIVALHGHRGNWVPWATGMAVLTTSGLVLVAVGAWAAHAVARRQPREELFGEGVTVTPREVPRSELQALVRTDRASVWRSVPLRRGFVVLALMPGAIAAAGKLEWTMLPVLPGLVAAGAALLFGVNAWSLDGVGALWRDSLPVRPDLVFAARVAVLCEMLFVATVLTLLIAGMRTGRLPTAAEAASLGVTVVVVVLQVVARSMHWSVHRPYAADLRSARATPAPPLTMVGYSAYLALTSTMTGMVFSMTAQAERPMWAVLVGMPFVLAAVRRLVITSREWETPQVRARVVATVAAR